MKNVTRPLAFVLASTNHGTLIVNRNDYQMVDKSHGYGVGFQLLNQSCFDPEEVDLVLRLLELRRKHFGDGVVAFDCGANIGIHTVEWARLMANWGSVIGIEAQERLYYALAGNIAINNCFNATAVHGAVGAENGILSIPRLDYNTTTSFGSFELKKRTNTESIGQLVDYENNMQEIGIVSIDSFDPARLDFIKIDVEGMELDVLDGARQSIERHWPQMLIESIKTDKIELLRRFKQWGYESFELGINFLAIHETDPSRAAITVNNT
ncbi:FkbM family methyltransferase [Pollutimonas subterranea]|uniref:FkbM family methyltransferase n=1 Tax=Pollutimonas subterranea TaxID=2045210 RepID=A0A2N4TYW6_9BURK|nr:FkbM family methyltransferase [Pollutimonas subterranea]PLC47960.1 FkbM family methyltransferase [Pollutimonas subterranea]